jgi:repressor LexA
MICSKCSLRETNPITASQVAVLRALDTLESRLGHTPSFAEIGREVGLSSLATIHKHVKSLEEKGFIGRQFNKSRSLAITKLGRRRLERTR